MILWAHHSEGVFYQALQDFVASRAFGKVQDMGKGTILAVQKGNRIVAGVLFHNYQPDFGVIEVSGAGDGPWLTKGILREMAEYAFGQMKCQAVVFRSDADNTRILRMAKAAGFTRVDVPHGRGRGKPEVVNTLTADDWAAGKFKGNNHGR